MVGLGTERNGGVGKEGMVGLGTERNGGLGKGRIGRNGGVREVEWEWWVREVEGGW